MVFFCNWALNKLVQPCETHNDLVLFLN